MAIVSFQEGMRELTQWRAEVAMWRQADKPPAAMMR
jgi:hypothetical protein